MANKKENLKVLKTEELEKKHDVLQEEIRVIRFKGQGAKSKNVKETAALRKQIARVLTELNQSGRRTNKVTK